MLVSSLWAFAAIISAARVVRTLDAAFNGLLYGKGVNTGDAYCADLLGALDVFVFGFDPVDVLHDLLDGRLDTVRFAKVALRLFKH